MNADDILKLAFGIPFLAICGVAAGLFVLGMLGFFDK